jgi:hypothetical protein
MELLAQEEKLWLVYTRTDKAGALLNEKIQVEDIDKDGQLDYLTYINSRPLDQRNDLIWVGTWFKGAVILRQYQPAESGPIQVENEGLAYKNEWGYVLFKAKSVELKPMPSAAFAENIDLLMREMQKVYNAVVSNQEVQPADCVKINSFLENNRPVLYEYGVRQHVRPRENSDPPPTQTQTSQQKV